MNPEKKYNFCTCCICRKNFIIDADAPDISHKVCFGCMKKYSDSKTIPFGKVGITLMILYSIFVTSAVNLFCRSAKDTMTVCELFIYSAILIVLLIITTILALKKYKL